MLLKTVCQGRRKGAEKKVLKKLIFLQFHNEISHIYNVELVRILFSFDRAELLEQINF